MSEQTAHVTEAKWAGTDYKSSAGSVGIDDAPLSCLVPVRIRIRLTIHIPPPTSTQFRLQFPLRRRDAY